MLVQSGDVVSHPIVFIVYIVYKVGLYRVYMVYDLPASGCVHGGLSISYGVYSNVEANLLCF